MSRGLYVRTPLLPSDELARAAGRPVVLKMESAQPAGSFKQRGIGALCAEHASSGARRLVSSSGGNAGLAAAHVGARLGLEVLVVVPSTTSALMRGRIEAAGATVEVVEGVWDDAHAHAVELAKDAASAYVSPFDHPTIWAGHASLIDEVAEELAKPPALVTVAVGGGGLLCGVILGLARAGWTDVPVLAVETEGAASLRAALAAKHPVTIDGITSIATSLGARRVCDRVVELCAEHPVTSHVVSDADAVAACTRFVDDHRTLVEPACGAALAPLYDRARAVADVADAGPILAVVCGGANVTRAKLDGWSASFARSPDAGTS